MHAPSPHLTLHPSPLLPCLPQGKSADDDALLQSGPRGRLAPMLQSRMPPELPAPEAAPSRADERPAVIRALESAVFGDREEEDDGACVRACVRACLQCVMLAVCLSFVHPAALHACVCVRAPLLRISLSLTSGYPHC